MNLYQINWKFRDEIRPRFGVMRGREFLMKDGYSFDVSHDKAKQSYYRMFVSYLRIFSQMGINAIPMKADPGPIGGDMSHEFIVLANTGESEVFLDKQLISKATPQSVDYSGDLESVVDDWMQYYAATDDEFDEKVAGSSCEELIKTRGIEVGHIFYFGQKYSDAMDTLITGADGNTIKPFMGSYGIGVSRLVGAIIESNYDEDGIIWPFNVSPYHLGIINLKPSDAGTSEFCENVYKDVQNAGYSVLYDDRDERAGVKFAEMDLLGLPWQLIVGPRGIKNKSVELKERSTGNRRNLDVSSFVNAFTDICRGSL
jgi:prolyl-tRNA synthetase